MLAHRPGPPTPVSGRRRLIVARRADPGIVAGAAMPDEDLDLQFLAALGHPVRLKAMVMFEHEAGSARELAEAVGLAPTAATHHVNVLKRAGLIEVVDRRQRRGYMESLYAPTATGWKQLTDELRQLARASRDR